MFKRLMGVPGGGLLAGINGPIGRDKFGTTREIIAGVAMVLKATSFS
jgi:hypothetical protein